MYTALILLVTGAGVCNASSKKGVAVAISNYFCGELDLLDGVDWWYNWAFDEGMKSCGHEKGGFVPMIWGYNKHAKEPFPELHFPMVLGFNEPNHGGQSNLSPQKAAQLWVDEFQRTYYDRILISPAAAPGGYIDVFPWFDQFFAECDKLGGCRVDYIATHLYTGNADYDIGFLERLYKRYNKKIWLTEFAVPHTRDERVVIDYMEKMLPSLEEADFVYRYSWFISKFESEIYGDFHGWYLHSVNSLITPGTHKLSNPGRFYNNFKSSKQA